jgi:hypothetical protein
MAFIYILNHSLFSSRITSFRPVKIYINFKMLDGFFPRKNMEDRYRFLFLLREVQTASNVPGPTGADVKLSYSVTYQVILVVVFPGKLLALIIFLPQYIF